MTVYEKMNEVIEYIEDNITNEIDVEILSKISACPISLLQRFFMCLTGITLADYINRRRLTLCALELRETNQTVTDVYIKYGYNSHSSFSRAFKNYHRITPSQARVKGIILNLCPKMSFCMPTWDKERGFLMNDNQEYRVFDKVSYSVDTVVLADSLKFIGLSTKGDYSKIADYHNSYALLIEQKLLPYTEIAVWQNISTEDGSYDYIYGCLVTSISNVPEGLVGVDTGFTKFAVITVTRDSIEELFDDDTFTTVHNNFMKMLPDEYVDQIGPPQSGEHRGFGTRGSVENGCFSLIEIYPSNVHQIGKLCFYVPLI